MLGKRSSPMIGKITELLISGNLSSVFSDVIASPKTPLDLKITSPRALKHYGLTTGVGLGIVAALHKSGTGGDSEVLARHAVTSPRPGPIRTDPIAVKSGMSCRSRVKACFEEPEIDSHGRGSEVSSMFSVSPAPTRCELEAAIEFQVSDFLSSCFLCQKKLHGKDIYMYRGEKAFCSTDCREKQIRKEDDDRKEQCRSKARRKSADVSSRSSYNRENMFSTGIMAI